MTPVAALLWGLAAVSFGNLVLRSYTLASLGDFRVLHEGAMRLVHGESVYADPWFLLTPSALFAVGPFGLLSWHPAFLLWNTLSVLAVGVAVVCTTRAAGAALAGPVPAVLLLGLSLSEALTSTLLLGNLNNSLLLALGSGFLLAERTRRPVAAGVLLGVALAVKPVLVLVLLLPALQRRWRTLGWAVAIPAVLNLAGLALVPHRGDFLAIALPAQFEARSTANSSLAAVGPLLGVPVGLVAVLRIAVLVVAVLAVWRLRAHPDRVLRSATSYGVLLLATFLASSLSQGYYSMLLLPLLVTALSPRSPMRHPLSWLGAYLCLTLDTWWLPQLGSLNADFAVARWTAGWLLLFAVVVTWAWRQGAAGVGQTAPETAGVTGDRVLVGSGAGAQSSS